MGCGHRGVGGFLQSLKQINRGEHVVALADPNPVRLAVAKAFLGNDCKTYGSLKELLSDDNVDTVIVATPDATHADLVCQCLAAGRDVVCEKPMATKIDDCQRMLAARGDRELRVAFNLRYHTVSIKVKEMLASGIIGDVVSVDARDIVGWHHGSDYFRRWHRFQALSGGLLVHKSTHTFDVVNWWLNDKPKRVFARGERLFYRPERQLADRCANCSAQETCPFYVDLSKDIKGQEVAFESFYKKMYLDAEKHDGYVRDACVFDKNSDIPDTYQVNASYSRGAVLSYSSVFYAPFEDRRFSLQGTLGRMEVSKAKQTIDVYFNDDRPEMHIQIPPESGGHGGADERLMLALFEDEAADISKATAEDGYWSAALAACANDSIQTGLDQQIPPPLG